MSRRSRLKFIRRWRKFRDQCAAATTSAQLSDLIAKLPEVKRFSYQTGWTCYVDIEYNDGSIWERGTFLFETLAIAANNLYQAFTKNTPTI